MHRISTRISKRLMESWGQQSLIRIRFSRTWKRTTSCIQSRQHSILPSSNGRYRERLRYDRHSWHRDRQLQSCCGSQSDQTRHFDRESRIIQSLNQVRSLAYRSDRDSAQRISPEMVQINSNDHHMRICISRASSVGLPWLPRRP
jgi:hypothetical protein